MAATGRRVRDVGERADRSVRPVLFVQGGGADAHDGWDHRLVASLQEALGPGYVVRYPRMPGEADPDPARWQAAIVRELTRIPEGFILVGHSIGAAILLDHLGRGEPSRRPAGVFLVAAPCFGEGGWPTGGSLRPTRELARDLDAGIPLFLYQGTQDAVVPVTHLDLLAKALPHAQVRRLEGRDHQLGDDLSDVAQDIRHLTQSGR